jgi:hypothetical protein
MGKPFGKTPRRKHISRWDCRDKNKKKKNWEKISRLDSAGSGWTFAFLKTRNILYDLRFSRRWLCRKPSSGILRRVFLVRTDVSEERIASIIRAGESRWEYMSRCLQTKYTAQDPRRRFPARNVISVNISRTLEFTKGVFKTLAYYSCRNTEATYKISVQIQGPSKYEDCIDQLTYTSSDV